MVESLYHNRSRAPSKNTGFKCFPAAARPVGLLPYLIFRIVLRRQGFHFTNFLCWEACTWSGLCVFSKGLENGFHLGGRDQAVFFLLWVEVLSTQNVRAEWNSISCCFRSLFLGCGSQICEVQAKRIDQYVLYCKSKSIQKLNTILHIYMHFIHTHFYTNKSIYFLTP